MSAGTFLVTGAIGEIGRYTVRRLLEKGHAVRALVHKEGVKKVYAGIRNPDGVDLPGLCRSSSDLTDSTAVIAAAHCCGDVTVLINNAGTGRVDTSALDPAVTDNAREIFETCANDPVEIRNWKCVS